MDWKEDQSVPLSLHFSFMAKKYVGAMTNTLSHIDLDRYFLALLAIEQSGETFTQQNLADYFQIDKASIVRVVGYLTEKGFIKRQVSTQDRRANFLVLTDKGKALVPDIRQSIRGLNEQALRNLTSEQTEAFFASLKIIQENLAEIPTDEVLLRFQKTGKRIRRKTAGLTKNAEERSSKTVAETESSQTPG
jgi:DNA-binding MarR family transcriptional regulator